MTPKKFYEIDPRVEVTDTPAYYGMELITTIKSFIVHAPALSGRFFYHSNLTLRLLFLEQVDLPQGAAGAGQEEPTTGPAGVTVPHSNQLQVFLCPGTKTIQHFFSSSLTLLMSELEPIFVER